MTASEVETDEYALPSLQSVSLKGVLHRYYHEQSGEMFTLGPVDLEFHRVEITFLVGGNGSGKTAG